MKYVKDFIKHFKQKPAFSLRECRAFLKEKGISQQYLKFFLHYLKKKGMMQGITKGYYTMHDDPIVAGFAFKPFYYGLQEALSLHDLWEQETNLVIITTRKVRTGSRAILGARVIIRRVKPEFFHGFEHLQHYDLYLPVSTPEKTLLDFLHFKEEIPKDALENIKTAVNPERMRELLKRHSIQTRNKIQKILGMQPENQKQTKLKTKKKKK